RRTLAARQERRRPRGIRRAVDRESKGYSFRRVPGRVAYNANRIAASWTRWILVEGEFMAFRPDKLTVKAAEAVQTAQTTATDRGNPQVVPLHLLHALLSEVGGIVTPLF